MTGMWLILIGALLLIFGITLAEVCFGILCLCAGIAYFAFKFNLLATFING